METTKLHVSVEAPGKHLVIDGSLVLLGELLEALKVRAPVKEQRRSSQPNAQGQKRLPQEACA